MELKNSNHLCKLLKSINILLLVFCYEFSFSTLYLMFVGVTELKEKRCSHE